ncbi:M23 family metallopeptidase [Actinophytocola gossypii]|uniref:M23 family metallopeptidase n=1 Tax=Actinophytocola gossypii TaxID=2812003 RepID=UPI0021A293CD|nr:M23 family metallopeptidase [Actinophytocola gossypii]
MLTALTAAGTVSLPSASPLAAPLPAAQQPSGSIDDQIAAADAELKAAQAKLAKTFAAFTDAEQRHRQASAAAKAAAEKVTRTRAEAEAAATKERSMRSRFDEFAVASYSQGSTVSSVSGYLGSDSPKDLLDRAAMMDVIAGEYVDVLDGTRRATDRKAAADRDARAALDQAVRDRDAAGKAKTDAQRAYQRAVGEQDAAKAEMARLADRRASLAAAQPSTDTGSGSTGPVVSAGGVVRPAEGTLTSTYGARWGTIHYGIDIANSIGTPILSAMSGEVIDSGPASGFGLWVRVQHADGLITVYGHINESLVSVGQQVAAGEQIATMGNRGQSTGPHLHFEVHQDGNKIDPLPWLSSHGVNL